MTATALFLATWAVQSAAAIILGLLAGRLARRAGPAVQSAIYRTTLLVAILCPLSAWSLGAIGLPSPIPGECLPPSLAASGPPPSPNEDEGKSTPSPPATPIRAGVPAPPPLPVAGPAPSVPPPAPSPPPLPTPTTSIALPPEPATAGTARAWGELVDDFIPWVLACWLGGIAFFMARLACAQGQMGCIRRASVPAGPEAQALCRELAEEMGTRAPPVLCTPFLFSPCLDGLLRPVILIPDGERPDDLRDVLIHELAHRARRDGPWNLLGRLATAALWFQPLIWKLARQVAASAEEVCDDHVVHFGADRNRYASLLLDLAGRRLPPLAPTGVGAMTYRSLLGRRVRRILDPARPASTKVGPRPLAATLAAGLLGILLAGWIGVSPAAICPAPDDAADHVAGAADDDVAPPDPLPPVGVIVRDGDTGKPIAGATVRRSIDMREEFLRADEQGRLRLARPTTFYKDRFWFDIWADGYVQRRYHWPEEGEPAPPAEVEVDLFAGEVGGGRIQDEAGRPVAGAQVLISGELADEKADREAIYNVPVTTDDQGRWQYGGFRNTKSVHLFLSHPDFVMDDPANAHQVKDIAALRARGDVQVLARGVRVDGRVLGPDGKGIPGATIRVASAPNLLRFDLPELATNERGEFRVQVRPGRETGLFIKAPGFSPDLKVVTPRDADAQRVESRLMNGRPFLGRVTDPRGAPIPGAFVFLDSWRGYRCLDYYAASGPEGRFRIEDAPEGEFNITVNPPGHMDIDDKEVAIAPGEQDFVAVRIGLMASGTLRDEETGAIIPDGHLELGSIDPTTGAVAWKEVVRAIRDGKFNIAHEAGDRKVRLRARALGYEPFESREFVADRGKVELDFPMRRDPRPGPSGMVVDPDGKLGIGVQVIAVTEERAAYLHRGGLAGSDQGSQAPVVATTGPDGRFSLPFLEGPVKLAFIHDRGCRILTGEDLKRDEAVRLQPWGRVEGRVIIDGQPAGNAEVMLRDDAPQAWPSGAGAIDTAGRPAQSTSHAPPRLSFGNYKTKTGADGRFTLDRIPPIDVAITYNLDGIFAPGALAKIEPGRTTRVELKGEGLPIVGRVAVPPPLTNEVDLAGPNLKILMSDRSAIPFPEGLEPEGRGAWLEGWWNSPEGKAYRSGHIARGVAIRPDGTFRIRDVPPGRYRINMRLFSPGSVGRRQAVAQLAHQFEVPGGAGDEPLDVGTLEMQPADNP